MLVEILLDSGEWKAFLCERPPAALLDAIFLRRYRFYDAAGKLSADQIWGMVPIVFPTTYQLNPELFPGVGKYAVDAANKEKMPFFSTISWITLCRKIAEKDLGNLKCIFDLCEELRPQCERR